jgi:glycosyltransferase involved in cell wall biosynthesis
MSNKKSVTLYVPAYNAAGTIDECLASVKKQTYPIDEVIVIDDGSTDDTATIASRHRVRLLANEKNCGLVYCRNTGCRLAQTECVAALDADCVAAPTWLEELMHCVDDSRVAGAGGKLTERYVVTRADRWRATHMNQAWGDFLLFNPPFLYGSNTVFKKAALERTGFYDARLKNNYEDMECSTRLYDNGFELVYNPRAGVQHARRDTVSSVLSNYRKWHAAKDSFEFLSSPASGERIRMAAGRAGLIHEHELALRQLFRDDIDNKNGSLLAIDALCVLLFLWEDAKSVMRAVLE